MLLDHKMIAGCGNIYACEALFRAGVLPERKVKDVSNQERQMLFYYVQEVLNEGINNGILAFLIIVILRWQDRRNAITLKCI